MPVHAMTEIQTADEFTEMSLHLALTQVCWKVAVLLETETAATPGAALGIRPVVATGPELRAPPRQRCGPGRPMPHREQSGHAELSAGKSTACLSGEFWRSKQRYGAARCTGSTRGIVRTLAGSLVKPARH